MSRDSLLGVAPGQVIAERYRIEGLIGRGAMGAVWRATHVRLNSPVAIKFLNPAIANDPEMLERFMREAQSAALVRSTHVVQIFDYGVERGAPYIAMELLVGESLEHRLVSRGALAAAELDKIFGEVARAVAVAHDVGVVHRDLKPGNVFVAREGGDEITKVLDFGIAKLLDQKLSSPTGKGTHTGIMLGTPHYMSPEQARGHRRIDHRTDLWALAVLAFECLTGKQPFDGEALGDLMVNICTSEPRLPSSLARVPLAFDAWFLKGVMKDPAARFGSAREMADALHVILSDPSVEVHAPARALASETGRTLALGVQPGFPLGDLELGEEAPERVAEPRPHGSLTTHGASNTEVRASSSVAPATSARSRLVPIVIALAGAGAAAASLLALRERASVVPARSSAALAPAPVVAPELQADLSRDAVVPARTGGSAVAEPPAPEPKAPEPRAPELEPLAPEKPQASKSPVRKSSDPRRAEPRRPVTRAPAPVASPSPSVQQDSATSKAPEAPTKPLPPPRDPFADRQ